MSANNNEDNIPVDLSAGTHTLQLCVYKFLILHNIYVHLLKIAISISKLYNFREDKKEMLPHISIISKHITWNRQGNNCNRTKL